LNCTFPLKTSDNRKRRPAKTVAVLNEKESNRLKKKSTMISMRLTASSILAGFFNFVYHIQQIRLFSKDRADAIALE
jgi:hypothetical protein